MDNAEQIEIKVEELVKMLREHPLNEEQARVLRQKINEAMGVAPLPESPKILVEPDETDNELDLLLNQHQLEGKASTLFLYRDKFSNTIIGAIGIITITLGLAMIIMPAPPYFEMFTIYYFTPDDGITLMDVIAVLIVFTGIYLLALAIRGKKLGSH